MFLPMEKFTVNSAHFRPIDEECSEEENRKTFSEADLEGALSNDSLTEA